jgi:hypothetical protein
VGRPLLCCLSFETWLLPKGRQREGEGDRMDSYFCMAPSQKVGALVEPKCQGRVYQKPYLDYYDQLPYSRGYRVPEFSKFSVEDGKTTLEHVGQFIFNVVRLVLTMH